MEISLKVSTIFKDATSCVVGSSSTVLLWHDAWQEQPPRQKFLESLSFENIYKISLAIMFSSSELPDNFQTPIPLKHLSNTMR